MSDVATPRDRTGAAADRRNASGPVTSLRDWLDYLAAHDRLALIRSGVGLRFELAAIAKSLDGERATLFAKPGGHAIPVVSGLVSDRAWIADAMGVEPSAMLQHFQRAALNPLPWSEVKSAPVQEVVHRDVDLARLLPIPMHNELDSGPYITAGLLIARNPRTGVQNVIDPSLPAQRTEPARRPAAAASHALFFEMAERGGRRSTSPSSSASIR